MKRVLFSLAICTVVFLSSCANKALEYNNKLVAIQKEITPSITAFGVKKNSVASSGGDNVKSLVPDAKKLVEDIDKKIADINKLDQPKDAEAFKNSLIANFQFVRKICTQVIKIADDNTSMEEKTAINDEMNNNLAEAQRLDDDVHKTQKAFADKSGFKIQ